MAQEAETPDKDDPQWRLLLLDVVNAAERLRKAKDEAFNEEVEFLRVAKFARRFLNENEER